MSLPIDMMREFCVRHKLGEEAMEEINKIIDASLIHAGRQFLSVAVVAKKPVPVCGPACPPTCGLACGLAAKKKPAAKKPAADRCKCEGKNKKGEPCRFYALEGMKHCKFHQESDGEEKPKRKKLVSNKKAAEDEYLGGIKNVVIEFFEHNKGKKLSELKFSLVRKFVAEKGIEMTNCKLLQDITKEVIQDLKLTEASTSDEDPETDDE